MYKNKRILALIPARGGSKGLPGKNTLSFHRKPLIAHSISQAFKSKYLDKVMVSTDSEKIAGVSRKHGACVPFLRPKSLASSKSNMSDVVIHALNYLSRKGEEHDLILLLQPTSPLRVSGDIDKAIELYFVKKASAVVSVCPCEHHPWLSATLKQDLKIEKLLGKVHKNRQELPQYYRLNGAVFLIGVDIFKKAKTFLIKNSYAYVMPAERSVDIDSRLDFEFAELLAKKNYRK